ncbi:mandelate racemase/muconate lactonizing enzyme family protein [Agaribacterium haliotis]|uniref:mandelate racemase/muconate lactonizing enzyme family protein n=1 Tax=Agaribacterium haliotis TaxID=2013869 RepID=UPI000BB56247|nr:mandelate racemase/muconate lactonizing enzyme family protein [Agaribacterium haliotis]
MKIKDIKAYAFWAGFRNVCIVKVELSNGSYGWGESGLSGRELAVAGAVKHFREFLLGKDARNISALWQEMYRGAYFEGGRVLSAAISAIDIALYDALGKELGLPVYQLLGGRQRDKIPLFATSIKAMGPELVEHLLELKAEGWQSLRVTTGEHGDANKASVFEPRESIANAAHWCTNARAALGPEVFLGIDYHHRLSVAECASFVQRMPVGTLDYLEEPIRDQSPEAYKALRSMVDVPFAIGEEFASKWDFAPYIQQNLSQFGRIDICNVGGFTEAMKVAAMCETHYIDMMPHNPLSPICTAASIHFCAAIPNLTALEFLPYSGDTSDFDRYFVGAAQMKNCQFDVEASIGLGIDVNEELIKDLEFRYWEAPRLQRRDGSYTNW